MNKVSDIQALLDRYWEGETSLEEERLLKSYFNSGNVDEHLLRIAPLFQALQREQSVQMTTSKVVEIRAHRFSWHGWAAAASVALLITAGFWWWSKSQHPAVEQIVQTNAPPQEAVTVLPKVAEPVQEAPAVAGIVQEKPLHKKGKQVIRSKPAVDPEAEKAMEEIKAALALVSSKIKKGKHEAAKGALYLEEVDKLFKIKPETEG